ncbi:MAG TPA: carboxypeptidase regulatory-like domain-containing protein [Actinoplanes sp.]|nr:carboxypeptidase regulatory-like domain-containing protein [Actinoplanes sp.]
MVLAAALALIAGVLPAQAQTPQAPDPSSFKPVVRQSLRNAVSAPLRDIAAAWRLSDKHAAKPAARPWRGLPKATADGPGVGSGSGVRSRAAARAPQAAGMPEFDNNFEGLGNDAFVLPPDTNGDVGPNHYMQWINLQFGIWDKDGNELVGSTPGNALFEGLGGPCESQNDGDPIVQYDHLADRWLASQFALFAADGHHQCIAISVDGDPTGSWYQYDFLISATKINDYPHFGVWPDGYYMTINQFDENTFAWAGAAAVSFERDAMLEGLPATMVYFDLFNVNQLFGGQLPADLDGFPPPEGTPAYVLEADDDAFGFDTDRVSMWDFHVDWDTPIDSTFGIDGEPNRHFDTDPFEADLCGFSRSCIPQPGTDQGLDAISDRLMYRVQYRTFDDHASLVASHTVDADGEDHAGIRWYELRDDGVDWSIHQQGTYAPDSDHRWMGSAAMDVSGDIAIGYSVSSSDTYPSIRAAGRLASDPLGELSQGESEMIAGSGSQLHGAARWGDYSMLAVDPVDQCTFWYTNEYLPETSDADWHTRIGHFKFPSCTTGPTGTLHGTVTDDATDDPIAGATVTAGPVSTTTDADGSYTLVLPVDTYDVSASAYGYGLETVNGVDVLEDDTTTVDFALDALPAVDVSGTVTDGSGHGWPLYARIDIDGYPFGPIFTSPNDGTYDVELVQSTDFTFHVTALSGGYLEGTRDVNYSTATATEDFALEVDPETCDAPGYDFDVNGIFERFQTEEVPEGWTIVDNMGSGQVWEFDDPGGRGNLTGGTGPFAIVDSDHYGPFGAQDTELISPLIDLTVVDAPILRFNTDYFPLGDTAEVDVSIDGGENWENVWSEDDDLRGPRVEEVPLPQAANEPDAMVRFHYFDAFFAFWWQVDNVLVGDEPVCSPVDGGLVVGHVFDGLTDEGLVGATVTSDDEPSDTTTTIASPGDPDNVDGFYSLFSSLTGTHDFTASKKDYGDDTEAVDVAADAVTVQNFVLPAGHLTVDPDSITVEVPLFGSDESGFTVHNDGTLDATYEIGERDLGFDILAPRGARVTRRTGTFSPHSIVGTGGPKLRTEPPKRPIPPPAAPPWQDVADYPMAIMDSTADVFEGLVYSVGGTDGGSNLTSGFVYDPGSDSWSPIADMAQEREKPAAAFVDGLLYVFGGWDNSGAVSTTLEIYDPASDTWTTGADAPVAYSAGAAVALDGLLYIVGGCQDTCGTTDVLVYDPDADEWSFAAPYPAATSWAHCGAIDGQIICAGGVEDPGAGELDTTYAYDPDADEWTQLASMPETRWAGGYIAAGGLLVVSGGVTDNFNTVTNEGFAYDPATDSWTDIPNSNNTVYRGASACGFYRIGGSTGGFSPVPAVELLPGLDACGGVSDVTWLSVDPTTDTVVPDGDSVVSVSFDANVPEVPQPGTYRANLTFKEDTPFTVPPLPVTMNVTPPADWGKLEGTVVGLARCDAPGDVLAKADVHIDGVDTDFDLKTDADGFFEWWMPEANGPVSVSVSKAGWVAEDAGGVAIDAGEITTQDFILRLDAPCAENEPDALATSLLQNDSDTLDLVLTNDPAAAGFDFSIEETDFALDPLAPTPATGPAPNFSAPAAHNGPLSVRSTGGSGGAHAPAPAAPPWFGANDIPGGLVRFAHAQCDGDPNTFYVVGGVDGNFELSDKLWRFDAGTTEWTELASIPEGGEGPTAACEAGQLHVMGGDGTDRHYIYNIGSDSWSTGAPLPRPVWGAAAAGFNGLIFLAGGDADFFFGGTSDEVDVYDIASDTWIGTGEPMPIPVVAAGFAQSADVLYLAGGWDDGSPDVNVAGSQAYNLTTNTWEVGPALGVSRSDFALAATDQALYSIGGDADGGGAFDATRTVERLDLSAWPDGAWEEIDQVSIPLVSNSGGFCSTATFDPQTEVWSAGGADSNLNIQGRMFFRQAAGETCPTIRSDVDWLSVNVTSGSVNSDSQRTLKVTVEADDLAVGEHDATLLITTTDPAHGEMRVPVHVTVVARPIVAYLSVGSSATLDGINIKNEDVFIVHDDDSVEMYFDGSDLSMGSMVIDAFAFAPDGTLVMSFTQPAGVPGITGTVDDSDLVRFVADSLGPDTAGTFVRYFDGSDVGLTTDAEDIDGLEIRPNGMIFISMVGSANLPNLGSADDSDIVKFDPSSLGGSTSGSWSRYFDGSDVGLNNDGEDVDALALWNGAIGVSTTGKMQVPGLKSADEDVSVFHPTQAGGNTRGSWIGRLFDGSHHGLTENDVTGVEIAP